MQKLNSAWKKFVFAKKQVKWVVSVVQSGEKVADPNKLLWNKPFHVKIGVAFLLRLSKAISGILKDTSSAKEPLRPLLSTSNPFIWTPDHDSKAFLNVKETPTSPPVLIYFHPQRGSVVQTVVLMKQRMNYVLLQKTENYWKLIKCNFHWCTDAKACYAKTCNFVRGALITTNLILHFKLITFSWNFSHFLIWLR